MQEEMLTLSQAAQSLPHRPHSSSIWRFCRRGVKCRNGERIRLPHSRMGGKLFIRRGDLDAFFRQIAETDCEYFAATDEAATPTAPKSRSDSQRKQDLAACRERLRTRGLKV